MIECQCLKCYDIYQLVLLVPGLVGVTARTVLEVQAGELFGQLAANLLEPLLCPHPEPLDVIFIGKSIALGFNPEWMDEIQEGDAEGEGGLSQS